MKSPTPMLQHKSISLNPHAREMVDGEHFVRQSSKPSFVTRHPSIRKELLVAIAFLGDSVVILLALCVGYWSRFQAHIIPFGAEVITPRKFGDYFFLILVGELILLASFAYLNLYEVRKLLRYSATLRIVVKGTVFWLFAYLSISLILKFQPNISRIYAISSCVCVLIGLLIWRGIFLWVMRWEIFATDLRERVIFVGWSDEANKLQERCRNQPAETYEIFGCLPSSLGKFLRQPPPHVPILGQYHEIEMILKERRADIVVLADLDQPSHEIIQLSNLCEREYAQFKIIPSYFQILISGLHLETIRGVPILGLSELPLHRFTNRVLKRSIDMVGSIAGLILSVPIYVVCGIIIYLESPGPIVFGQDRMGRQGRIFKMYKLRSMRLGAETTDHLNQSTPHEDGRLLRCGKFMRAWNLDETPQFWNVLKGDMSLVGPRPERVYHSEHLRQKIPHYCARHITAPGMSGWAQVNGFRGGTDLEARIRYDLYYLENWSIWLDVRIIIRTFLTHKNAY